MYMIQGKNLFLQNAMTWKLMYASIIRDKQ